MPRPRPLPVLVLLRPLRPRDLEREPGRPLQDAGDAHQPGRGCRRGGPHILRYHEHPRSVQGQVSGKKHADIT